MGWASRLPLLFRSFVSLSLSLFLSSFFATQIRETGVSGGAKGGGEAIFLHLTRERGIGKRGFQKRRGGGERGGRGPLSTCPLPSP